MKKILFPFILLFFSLSFLEAKTSKVYIYQIKIDSVFSTIDEDRIKRNLLFKDYKINVTSPIKGIIKFPKKVIMKNDTFLYEAKKRSEKIYKLDIVDSKLVRGETVHIKKKLFSFNINGIKFKAKSLSSGFKKIMVLTLSGKIKSL